MTLVDKELTGLVFNLGNFNTVHYLPIHIMLKMTHSIFSRGPFDKKAVNFHMAPSRLNTAGHLSYKCPNLMSWLVCVLSYSL